MTEGRWNGKPIEKMGSAHLTNTIRWVEQKWWESDEENPQDLFKEYSDLVEEATKRKMLDPNYEPKKEILGL